MCRRLCTKNFTFFFYLQLVGEDGILYADLEIFDKPPTDPDMIHGKENLVTYATIEFTKLK